MLLVASKDRLPRQIEALLSSQRVGRRERLAFARLDHRVEVVVVKLFSVG